MSAAWQRAIAWAGLVLTGVLVICAASPQAHAWLHGREFVIECFASPLPGAPNPTNAPVSADDEAGCVITQFAQGWVSHFLTLLVLLALMGWLLLEWAFSPNVFPNVGHCERPRCCGPPAL